MKKLYFLIVILPLFTFGQSNKYVRQGLRTQNLEEQISLFSQAIEIDSKNLDAYFYRGLAKFNLEKYHEAILDYTKVIFYKPDADSYYNRANAKFNLNDYEGALIDYTRAIEIDPDLIDAYYNLGNTKYFLGDYEGAIKNLTTVINTFPSDANAYTQRANAHFALKNYKEAFKDYRYAIIANPNESTYYNRGLALLDVKYFKEAKNDFFKVLKLNKNNVSAHFYLATSHLFLGEFSNAISIFKTCSNRDNLDYEAHLGLAITYLKSNNLIDAENHFQKAKNILGVTDSTVVTDFESSYWYQNHYFYFDEAFKKLISL